MIRLKERLLKIAYMAQEFKRPADIGTDHAYIPIFLVQTGACSKVIATDIRKGPLLKAGRNIKKYHLEDRIDLRMGDGIKPIRGGECDSFIIAGMGGVVIAGIIDSSVEVVKRAESIILQPVYTEEVLRKYLLHKGFRIETESLVRDDRRIYVVIKASYDGVSRQAEDLYLHIGKKLFENKDPLLKEYLEKRIRRHTKIVNGIASSIQKDKEAYMQEKRLLEQMKKAYADYF